MDGNDGLAASMAVLGFAAYGVGAVVRGRAATAYFALAAATLPFFAVNCPPARMFMGDVGAVPLGFLAAAFGIGGVVAGGSWPAWFPALVFLPFIADATITLARRALAPRDGLGGASDALLSAAAPAGRRTSRDARRLWRADGRNRGITALACLRWQPRAGAGRRLLAWCVAGAALVRGD